MHRSTPPDALSVSELWITGGTATAAHRLSAFDAALEAAGIHNANLIRVSSITPASATTRSPEASSDLRDRIQPGSMIPAVYARAESDSAGEQVYAAVAGVRLEDGYGINVETHGTNDARAEVRSRCERLLAEMADTRDQQMAGDPWLHFESQRVPRDDGWGAATAAIVYL